MTRFATLLALVVGVGAISEIAVAIHPGLLPAAADRLPFMATHHTSLWLRAWILASNAVNATCASMIVMAATARPRGTLAWRRMRDAARVLRAVAVCGLGVCLPLLLPLPSDGEVRTMAAVMLASVVAASLGLAVAWTIVVRAARRYSL